jgi:hypothetical protein
MCLPLWCGILAHDCGDRSAAEYPRFAAGAKRGSRSYDIIPYIDQKFLLILMSQNLDELPPITAGRCNTFGGKRIATALYGFQLCEEAADQMKTLPATHMGLSETHNLELETQKSERETLVVTCPLECIQELARGNWTAGISGFSA